jgi:hypothetical protein
MVDIYKNVINVINVGLRSVIGTYQVQNSNISSRGFNVCNDN